MKTMISKEDKLICLTEHNHANMAVNPPIYQTSVFHFEKIDDFLAYKDGEKKAFAYSRGDNPTVQVLEEKLALLDGAEKCRAFGSGMGAIAATLFTFLKSGDHVLFINNIYAPTLDYLDMLASYGVSYSKVSVTEVNNLADHVKENTRIIFTESPSTMFFDVVDLRAIAKFAKEHGIISIIDNTCPTQLLQKPIQLGFDLAVYSLTKYVCGHSDVLAGAVVGSRKLLSKIEKCGYKLNGAVLSPNDAFLIIRGLRTLPSRLENLAQITQDVVAYLQTNNKIAEVLHPLVYDETRQKLYQSQATGIVSLLSIRLKTNEIAKIKTFIDNLQTFQFTFSWGGFESLVMVNDVSQLSRDYSDNLVIRLSIGLLDSATTISDIEQALELI